MGRRGPQKTPTAILKLHGSRKAEGRKNEPKPANAIPRCPAWLTGEGRKEWRRICPQLKRMGVLTKIDRTALGAFCKAYSRWLKAERELEKIGELIKSPSGYSIQNPWLAISNKSMKQMLEIMREFGMSPASRAGLHVEKQPDADDPLSKLLARKGA